MTLRVQCWLFAIGAALFATGTAPHFASVFGAGLRRHETAPDRAFAAAARKQIETQRARDRNRLGEPYRDAVADARASVSRAQQKLAQAQEDFDAKKKLVDLGALAQDCLDESASRLADATVARADAEARLATAQDLLSAQEKRAAQAEATARRAAQVPDVEVVLGSGDEPKATRPARVAQAEKAPARVQMESGVEVIRGIPQSEGPRRARPVSSPAQPLNRKQPATPAPAEAATLHSHLKASFLTARRATVDLHRQPISQYAHTVIGRSIAGHLLQALREACMG